MRGLIPGLVGLALLCSGAQANADISSGLAASFPFNGNANDASGNGNNGVVYGATLIADRFGNANSAYSFDGTDDYVRIADSPGSRNGDAASFQWPILPILAASPFRLPCFACWLGCGLYSAGSTSSIGCTFSTRRRERGRPLYCSRSRMARFADGRH